MADGVLAQLVSQRAVVIFSDSSCCMCHTVKELFVGQLGVNPAIYELDEDPNGKEMEKTLARMLQSSSPLPAVFIGGKLVGPTDRIMSLHLSGKLVPLLRDAGAIWL